MDVIFWIIGSTIAMSLFALIGLPALMLSEKKLRKLTILLVALSAGSLLGGAMLHLIPEALEKTGLKTEIFLWVLVGFISFFLLEQFLQWHHCHKGYHDKHKPLSYLILISDGIHNFIGGMVIAGSFLVSVEVGIVTWFAAASHEIPQEFGDLGILLHSGWDKYKALAYNFISALAIVPGGLLVYFAAGTADMTFLLPFAAGNFIYIACSDLIPEIKHRENPAKGLINFSVFLTGILLIVLTKAVFGG
jgi:zinc and cadmium transporter